ncbi:unnamed protein product, partial [Tilletia controversa]
CTLGFLDYKRILADMSSILLYRPSAFSSALCPTPARALVAVVVICTV